LTFAKFTDLWCSCDGKGEDKGDKVGAVTLELSKKESENEGIEQLRQYQSSSHEESLQLVKDILDIVYLTIFLD